MAKDSLNNFFKTLYLLKLTNTVVTRKFPPKLPAETNGGWMEEGLEPFSYWLVTPRGSGYRQVNRSIVCKFANPLLLEEKYALRKKIQINNIIFLSFIYQTLLTFKKYCLTNVKRGKKKTYPGGFQQVYKFCKTRFQIVFRPCTTRITDSRFLLCNCEHESRTGEENELHSCHKEQLYVPRSGTWL